MITTPHYEDDFAGPFYSSEPKRCVFDLEGQCSNDPVKGHFIQAGLLKLIQDSKKQIISFYNFQARNWNELDVEFALDQRTSPAEAANLQFLCTDHERFFWCVENPSPDWNDPEHKARLLYRVCLMNRYVREWFIEFGSNFPFLRQMAVAEEQQLRHVTGLESATRNYLNGTDLNQLRHTVAHIEGRPIIAASGVILHPLPGSAVLVNRDYRVIPMSSSPIAITILPAKREQVAMFSYTLEGSMDARHLLDGLEYHNGTIGTARLSKKLLEEMEVIHISPQAWASLGRPKQENITQYWKASYSTSQNEVDIFPSHVDLFATGQ